MNNSARISKPVIREILDRYLDKTLAGKIFWEMVEQDAEDQKNMVGMTYGEWKERFDDDRQLVWADDTKAGFGKAGDPVYGDADDCVICRTMYDGKRYKLYLWVKPLTTDVPWINAAMKEYEKRHQAQNKKDGIPA